MKAPSIVEQGQGSRRARQLALSAALLAAFVVAIDLVFYPRTMEDAFITSARLVFTGICQPRENHLVRAQADSHVRLKSGRDFR